MKKDIAQNLISKTRDDYNLIADQFASTRKYNWGDLKKAFEHFPLKDDDKVLDLGCGNGRMFELMDSHDIDYYGLDISSELLKYAKRRVPKGHFKSGNLLENDYNDNAFDAVVSIATLHHVPTKAARAKSLSEIYRITKPGGKIMISNWYFWNQPQYRKQIFRNMLMRLIGRSDLEVGDFFMEWKNANKKVLTSRYFHAWTMRETTGLLRKVGFTNIEVVYHKDRQIGRNLIVIAKKT